jgi:hypothetical protein
MQNYFQPKPGNFGVMRAFVQTGEIGPANFLGGATPLTANQTTIFRLGSIGRKAIIQRLTAVTVTVPADADGAITATLVKYDNSADDVVTITTGLNLETLVTREATSVNPISTLTDAQLMLDAGDALEVHVVNNSAAINTQPAGLIFTADLLVLE